MPAASTTPYKDELIRVGVILGLADDADPTSVSEAVQALKETADDGERRTNAERNIRETAENTRNAYRDQLTAAALALDEEATGLRQARERARGAQAYADMSASVERLERLRDQIRSVLASVF